MVRAKVSVKATGGMNKNFISEIRNSPAVNRVVMQEGDGVKTRAEKKASVRSKSGYKFHYGRKNLKGSWGVTVLIWPVSRIAMKNTDLLKKSSTDQQLKPKGDS